MKHLKYFPNAAAIGSGIEVDLPNVSYLEGKNVLYVPGENDTAIVKVNSDTGEIERELPPDYSTMYLTFEVIQGGTFTFTGAESSGYNLKYSLDDGAKWSTLSSYSTTKNFSSGTKIIWKATGLTPKTNRGIGTISSTAKFNVYGNVMSLLYGDEFVGKTDLTNKSYAFCKLFNNCSSLIDASNLVLPATILASSCYESMFDGCTSLTTAPAILPATTLASNCYSAMFNRCTSLTTAPTLPATTLASGCYGYMFTDCTSLTAAPALPATTLLSYCYSNMFKNCANLNYIKAMFTTTPSTTYTEDWVSGVSSTGTFVKNSAATWNVTDINGIPSGWTVETASS